MTETTLSIEERAAQIVEEFAFFDDWLGRYEYLIELGKELPLIDDAYKTDAFRIRGCQSQVWLRPELEDGRLHFKADSDALITKGLIALLVRVLDGESPENVADADLAFLEQIGMNEHLSPTRKNGLNAMVERIRAYASAARDSGEIAAAELAHTGTANDGTFDEEVLRENVIDAMKLVYDPEIPVNVFDLGLIYDVLIYPDRSVKIVMTLTTPNCPAAGILPGQVETRVANVDGVSEARVELTFDPPYTPDRMSEAAKLELGFL